MAGPKQFDRSEVRMRNGAVFGRAALRHVIQDVVEATGVGRGSLYIVPSAIKTACSWP
jgi:hypothetical protein